MPSDSEGEERNDVHEPLPEGGVGLDETSLYVTQEDLEVIVATTRVLGGQRTPLNTEKHLVTQEPMTEPAKHRYLQIDS